MTEKACGFWDSHHIRNRNAARPGSAPAGFFGTARKRGFDALAPLWAKGREDPPQKRDDA
jgi:hypothetical protein